MLNFAYEAKSYFIAKYSFYPAYVIFKKPYSYYPTESYTEENVLKG